MYWHVCPGGPPVFEVGYHPRKKKKNHVITVVFQDLAMYVLTSFRGVKMRKVGKKGVFLVMVTNFGKDMLDKLRKTHVKVKRIFRVYFHTWKYVFRGVLKVLLWGWYPAWNTSAPPHAWLYLVVIKSEILVMFANSTTPYWFSLTCQGNWYVSGW